MTAREHTDAARLSPGNTTVSVKARKRYNLGGFHTVEGFYMGVARSDEGGYLLVATGCDGGPLQAIPLDLLVHVRVPVTPYAEVDLSQFKCAGEGS